MTGDRPLRLVVFDCDGTLVDSQHVIVAAMNAAWAAAGRDTPPAPEAVRRVVGLPLEEAIARLLPAAGAAEHQSLAEGYKTAFRAQRAAGRVHEPLFPGARAALDALAADGALLGVATGKGRTGLELTLGQHDLLDRFVTLQTSDVAPGKPSPEMLYRAMDEAGTAPADTVMIGDTSFDILMALNADVAAIGVSWGYHEPAELAAAGAHRIVHSFAELPAALAESTKTAGGEHA